MSARRIRAHKELTDLVNQNGPELVQQWLAYVINCYELQRNEATPKFNRSIDDLLESVIMDSGQAHIIDSDRRKDLLELIDRRITKKLREVGLPTGED